MSETTLRQVEIFQDLDGDQLRHLATLFIEVPVPAEQVVFRRHHSAQAFYVVQEGQVDVYEDVPGKPPQVLARLGPGEYFGEFGIYDELAGTVTARTREASRILEITKEDLLAFMAPHPTVALRLQLASSRRPRPISLVPAPLQRRQERIPVEKDVILTLDDSTSCRTTIENLSPDGVCLRDGPADWREADQQVRFHLGIGAGMLQLGGQIVWRHGKRVGIEFTQKSRSHDMKIEWALRQLLGEGEDDSTCSGELSWAQESGAHRAFPAAATPP